MRIARLPESSVEVCSVGILRNWWVQIRAATEPAFCRDQKASVHMNGWHMGIGHVRHETDSCGEKLRIFIRAMNCLCKLRGEGAADCRNIHAYLFENAALHHAADAAAAFAGPEPLRLNASHSCASRKTSSE